MFPPERGERGVAVETARVVARAVVWGRDLDLEALGPAALDLAAPDPEAPDPEAPDPEAPDPEALAPVAAGRDPDAAWALAPVGRCSGNPHPPAETTAS